MYTDRQKFISWLKARNLYSLAHSHYSVFKKVYTDMLRVKRRDDILILSDLGQKNMRVAPVMAACYLMAARDLSLQARLVLQKVKQAKEVADSNVVQALQFIQEDNHVNLCLTGKLGSLKHLGKSFRRLVHLKRLHFTSTMNLQELDTKGFRYIADSIDVDLRKMQMDGERIRRILDKGSRVTITTPAGTYLKLSIKGMQAIANDGRYHEKGGNIPTGEVYIPPRGAHVDGKVVIDGSVRTRYGTIVGGPPVTLEVRSGNVVSIGGLGRNAKLLRKTLEWAKRASRYHWGVRRIGELGIGINPRAQIVGPTVINEKTRGTAHIAIGSNAWFGGTVYSIIHLDQVFRNPRIWVDDKRLIV